MKKKQKKIKYCNTGLANSYENHIEINKGLKKNKRLRDIIIKHELGHSDKFDLLHEFDYSIFTIFFPLMIFILKNPSTWIDFLPFQYKKKAFVFDLNISLLYLIILTCMVILKIMYF